jgi:CRISPR/Cas system-associated protein Cas5 (RAMP superfamily)
MKFYNFNYKFVNGEYIIKEKYESKVKIKHHLYLRAKNKEYYLKCTCIHNNNDFRDLTNWTKIDYSKIYECNSY